MYVLRKHSNAFLTFTSYLGSNILHEPHILGMPLAISTELTNICNLNCPQCIVGSGQLTRPKGFMEMATFDKIIMQLKPYLYHTNIYFQGEPMMHPDFFDFIDKSEGFWTTVSTNGHFLDEENADRLSTSRLRNLIVSLDGIDQEAYSAYRKNGDITVVIDGIRNVSEAIKRNSSKMTLTIQTLVNRYNEHQIPEIKQFANDIGAKLCLKSMQIIDDDFTTWAPEDQRYNRYDNNGNGYTIKNQMPNRCFRLWTTPVITWNGDVLPCCFDKNGEHVMGNINDTDFRNIWNGPKYRLFRSALLHNRKSLQICRNCTSGLRQKA